MLSPGPLRGGRRRTVLIVGAGLAGGRAAEALRGAGFEGRVVLVGDEPERPYERPPLSKELLTGALPRERVFLRPPGYYRDQRITLRRGRPVVQIDPAARRVTLDGGSRLRYDALLLTPGARPRRLGVPGEELPGVLALRTLADADRLRQALTGQPRVLVVGAGFLGCEVAAVARQAGHAVTVVEQGQVPMAGLGRAVGGFWAGVHRDHGVRLLTGETVTAFRGVGRVEAALTGRGELLPCDLVLVAVGVEPVTDLLAGTGVALENGIAVDEHCRTSRPDIYAAGDAASWWHPGRRLRLRVEHYDHAQNQGAAAARNLLGLAEPYAPIPYFWSQQYDLTLQHVGHAPSWDALVWRGPATGGTFSAFYLENDRVRACVAVNRFKDIAAARRLIALGQPVDPRRLGDDGVPLRDLLPPA